MSAQGLTTTHNDPTWQIRPYAAGDEHQLLTLFERTYGKHRTLEDWHWKFAESPSAGKLDTIWVAELPGSGRIVGHYAGIPLRVKMGSRVLDAMLSVETMTDPEFRRQGMLTKFGEVVYIAWASEGRSLVIGLPNQQWGSRKGALGWVPLFPLAWLRFPVHAELAFASGGRSPQLLRALARLPLMAASRFLVARARRSVHRLVRGDVVCRPYNHEAGVFDNIWAHACASWTNAVVRDDRWVLWRYPGAEPEPYQVIVAWRAGHPVGYIAFRIQGSAGRLTGSMADVFTARNDHVAVAALVVAALNTFRANGVGLAVTLAIPGSALHEDLRRLGFLGSSAETSFSFEVVPLDPDLSVSALGGRIEWHLAGGDSDVI